MFLDYIVFYRIEEISPCCGRKEKCGGEEGLLFVKWGNKLHLTNCDNNTGIQGSSGTGSEIPLTLAAGCKKNKIRFPGAGRAGKPFLELTYHPALKL